MSNLQNKPLVSVLMCVYNTKVEYLEEASSSILNQTYQDIEFIIVDDGSSEQSTLAQLSNICSRSDKVRLIRNNNNIGLTKSLNIGLKKCSGKYIARMDADDVSTSDRIEKQVLYMELHPEIALLGGSIYVFEGKVPDTVDVLAVKKSRLDNLDLYGISSLIMHSGPAHPTFMLRRTFLDQYKILYREEIKCAQDYGLMVDILKYDGIIREIPEVLLFYRIHGGQITSKSSDRQVEFQKKISSDYLRYRFPSLSEEESNVLASIKQKGYMAPSKLYVVSMKKMFMDNQSIGYYNQHLLEREFKYIWINKVVTSAKRFVRPWMLVSPYTISCMKSYREYKKKRGFV